MRMKVHKGYKFRLLPNVEQSIFLNKSFGCARLVYNHFLNEKIELWEQEKKSLSRFDMQKELKDMKDWEGMEFLKEINSQTLQYSLLQLDTAYKNFFNRIKKSSKEKGFPKFKHKGNHDSFHVPQFFKIENNKVKIPKLKTELKFNRSRTIKGEIKSITISKEPTNKYFITFLVEEEIEQLPISNNHIGIDLGIKEFAVISNGEHIEHPKILKHYETKLIKEQKKLSKKISGSNNRNKQRIKVAKIYEKITNTRKDFLHKLSTRLIRENQSINLEDLNVKGMVKNHKLAKSILDSGWSEFRRMLEYKASWHDREIKIIPTFYPSSKTCSSCGYKFEKLDLGTREWKCPECNTIHDRDENASKNILNYNTVGTTERACGEMKQPAFLPTNLCETGIRLLSSYGNSNLSRLY